MWARDKYQLDFGFILVMMWDFLKTVLKKFLLLTNSAYKNVTTLLCFTH